MRKSFMHATGPQNETRVSYDLRISTENSLEPRSLYLCSTHEVRKDGKDVQLGIFVRHLLVLAVQELAHQDMQGVVLEELLFV